MIHEAFPPEWAGPADATGIVAQGRERRWGILEDDMKERPILFKAHEVVPTLDGRKTQTRRVFKFAETNQPPSRPDLFNPKHVTQPPPFGTIGDRLWVRETWAPNMGDVLTGKAYYKAGAKVVVPRWHPSIHMPRWASRITLEITGVRVERLNDISEEDAMAEGVFRRMEGPHMEYSTGPNGTMHWNAKAAFRDLWQSIYGNWDANPWVWVYEFRKM